MKIINTKLAPAAIGPYSQATLKNGILFISGQLGFQLENGLIADSFDKQAELVFEHLKNILNEAGMTFKNAVKVTVYVKDMNKFPVLNEIYKKHFTEPFPAREVVQVSELPRSGDVEISLIAME